MLCNDCTNCLQYKSVTEGKKVEVDETNTVFESGVEVVKTICLLFDGEIKDDIKECNGYRERDADAGEAAKVAAGRLPISVQLRDRKKSSRGLEKSLLLQRHDLRR